jgi:hypothetical protein
VPGTPVANFKLAAIIILGVSGAVISNLKVGFIAVVLAFSAIPSLALAAYIGYVPKIASTPAPSPVPASAAPASANGIYVLDGVHRNTIDSKVLQSSAVDGVVFNLPWNLGEPLEGTFNWAPLDGVLAQAAANGKRVSVVLGAGWQTPSWVYADGARQFNFVWDHSNWGPALCNVAAIPIPWDAVYLAKWTAFVAAAGARYDSNPTVASVKVTGLNSKTQEIFLPTSVKQRITSGATSCTSYDDVADWQAAGYTRLKVESAWASVIEIFAQAFPDKRLEPMLIPGGFPALDDNGNRFPSTNNQDGEVTSDIITMGVSEYPSQFTLQNDGWSDKWIWQTEQSYAAQILTGYQEISALKGHAPAAITAALNSGASYLEFYESDATDPSVQGPLLAARQALQ